MIKSSTKIHLKDPLQIPWNPNPMKIYYWTSDTRQIWNGQFWTAKVTRECTAQTRLVNIYDLGWEEYDLFKLHHQGLCVHKRSRAMGREDDLWLPMFINCLPEVVLVLFLAGFGHRRSIPRLIGSRGLLGLRLFFGCVVSCYINAEEETDKMVWCNHPHVIYAQCTCSIKQVH